jgi:zinc/manganese transport system substrate-binding protein
VHRSRISIALCVMGGVLVAACGPPSETKGTVESGKPVVVATYSILGDVVRQLVGDAATVDVIIPNGQDPHEYSASARDVEQMADAALIVSNGLGLEEGLVEPLAQVEDDGVSVFRASDHVTVRQLQPGEPADEHDDGGDGDHHDDGDPHLWTDPLTIAALATPLAAELQTALGVDLSQQLAAFLASMTELDAQVRHVMSAVPAGQCVLVTGHDSLGYFAQRYGCTVIGAVIPSLSSTAEASARDLADLLEVATEAGVPAIFTEVGTPAHVAEQIAGDIGVPLIELPSHNLPDAGGYQAYILDLATKIADGLSGAS